jgi:hypothetical protein
VRKPRLRALATEAGRLEGRPKDEVYLENDPGGDNFIRHI